MHRDTTSIYYNTVINNTINFCDFLNGTDNNPLARFFIDEIKDSLPKTFLHACPYYGNVAAYNVTIAQAPQSSMFLQGFHKVKFIFHDKDDDNIFTAILITDTSA